MAKRRGIGDLFFIKRRPKWRIAKEWQRPESDDALKALIAAEDFVTEDDITAFIERVRPKNESGRPVALADFKTVLSDLAILHNFDFIGEYFKNNQASQHYQNLYYRYNWLFGTFAVLTTLATVLTLAVAGSPANSPERMSTAILAAVMGAMTTFLGTRMRTVQPQRRWYTHRRRTEALRSHYFLFLAHARPYRGTDYQRQSQLYVTTAQVESIGKTSASTAETRQVPAESESFATSEHEEYETAFIKESYIHKRYDRQLAWYEDRVGEFEENSSFTALVSGILLAIASIAAAFSAFVDGGWAQIVITVIPSAAATLVSAQQIYGWDRQAGLYEETISRLKDLRGKLKLDNPAVDNEREVADAVAACEAVFSSESDQWGQDVLQSPMQDNRTVLLEQLDDTLEQINLPGEVKQRIRKLAEGSDQLRRTPTEVANPVEPPVS